jgi:hypothetical protein
MKYVLPRGVAVRLFGSVMTKMLGLEAVRLVGCTGQ